MKYVAIAIHPPHICPTSNAVTKDAPNKALGKLESVSKRLNVKVEGGYVLAPKP